MDYEDMRTAMFDALEGHAKQQEERAPTVAAGMIRIDPFDAENIDGEPCRAIGVVTNPGSDYIEFVVLKTVDGGEMFPTTEGSLWRRKAA
ncbi:hypothetical protein B5M44_21520 [Shinella sumterensis]|uniref:hypothetical protein n=1 Tax=Shinella sumterensis TaxID=1967501 RepID=UPI00106E6C46|nr:hypothetical protein [Shinella sumterensis]MCD1266845.1 hypothetical protein [Shinella sumterensis]TFE95297.1 hypothetical protein B5M44_21520 [Shinella sumterensis]